METRSEFKFHPNLKSPEAGYDQGHLSRERSKTEAGRESPPLKSFLLQRSVLCAKWRVGLSRGVGTVAMLQKDGPGLGIS